MSVQPVTLTWKKLTAAVKDKIILNQSTGFCKPGQMLAIMGPSGSGKTTLLSLLTGKNDKQITSSGRIMANKATFNPEQFYNFGAYIYQNDILYQTLTVRETLTFTARLKFRNEEQAQNRVKQLIAEFQLQKCQNVMVGGQLKKGISGGQKKRVCIAVQMVVKPSLLILDEPTSGLDSNKAARVLKVLKKLANQGHTILFTLHQPSYLLYSMLDRLIILNFGETIYQGQANQIEPYLQKLGVAVPITSTICDYFMLQLSQFKKKRDNYVTPFNCQNYNKYQKKSLKSSIKEVSNELQYGFYKNEATQTFFKMFKLLLAREWLNYKRNPMKFGGMIGNAFIMVIILGLFFINSMPSIDDILTTALHTPPSEILSKINFMFMQAQGTSFVNITSSVMVGIFSVALAFPMERPIYYKESSSKKYTPLAYFIAKITVQVSSVIVGNLLYSSIGYWLLGYEKAFSNFVLFAITMVIMALVGNSIGFLTGSLFQDPKKASGLSPVMLLPLMMFSGIYNKLNSIPGWISWLQYISPFRYGLHMLLLNQYEDLVIESGAIVYDYKKDLAINLSYGQNMAVLIGLSLLFYSMAFVFLLKLTKRVSV